MNLGEIAHSMDKGKNIKSIEEVLKLAIEKKSVWHDGFNKKIPASFLQNWYAVKLNQALPYLYYIKEDVFTTNCIRTYTGVYFNLVEPTLEMINIEDIAHSLSLIPRFNGHTELPISVAEHSIKVFKKSNIVCDMAALMHDASEAYLCDIPSPLKRLLQPQYGILEDKIMRLISEKFDFSYPFKEHISMLDKITLLDEWEEITNPSSQNKYIPMTAKQAEETFLFIFKQIY